MERHDRDRWYDDCGDQLIAGGLNSTSDAVGYARGSDLFGASGGTFAGVAIDANCLVWRYAMCGDADLNGVVNFDDYSRIDNALQHRAHRRMVPRRLQLRQRH